MSTDNGEILCANIQKIPCTIREKQPGKTGTLPVRLLKNNRSVTNIIYVDEKTQFNKNQIFESDIADNVL